jgi:prepilin peptidase CpaA
MLPFFLILCLTLLIYLSYQDYSYRHLSNKGVGSLALLTGVLTTLAIVSGQYESGWWLLSQPLSVLGIGFGLFVFGVCGAGDVKLLAAIAPAISPDYWLATLILIAILGGLLALLYLVYGWYYNKLEQVKKRGLPYGIAIASAGSLGMTASVFIKI